MFSVFSAAMLIYFLLTLNDGQFIQQITIAINVNIIILLEPKPLSVHQYNFSLIF